MSLQDLFRRMCYLGLGVLLAGCAGKNVGQTFNSGFVEIEGAKIYYETMGKGSPVVLIHGGAIDRRMWDNQFEKLAEYYLVVRYDIPGHGKSQVPDHEFSHADILLNLLKSLDIDRASIIGLSLGGMIATDFAIEYPEMATTLVLSGSGLIGYQWPTESTNRINAIYEIARSQGARQAAEKLLEEPYMIPAMENPAICDRVRQLTIENARFFVQYMLVRWASPPAIVRLSEIHCPTLVVIGDRDTPDLLNIADTLENGIPDVEKAVVEDAGHIIPMEKPDEFNQLVLDFLSRQVKPHATCIPYPPNGAMDVRNDPKLSWTPGEKAAKHDVYFSTDVNAIKEANKSNEPAGVLVSRNQSDTTYKPGMLDFNTTYYWRVDEVNESNIWKGAIWSFSTGNYSVVDNFEDYNDYLPETLSDAWLDGYDDPSNGSTVGYPDPDFSAGEHYLETTIVHGGKQSMPLYYDNTTSPFISRTDRIFKDSQDWSRGGMQNLIIWTRGIRPLLGGYVYNSATGLYTVTGAGADIWGPSDQFHYVYKRLSGSGYIQAKVLSLANTDDPNTTDVWAKAGVMIREMLEAESIFASVSITPTQGCHFQARVITAQEAIGDSVGENDVDTVEQNAIVAPYWIKLKRDADGTFSGYYSADGTTWTTMTWSPQTISMNGEVYIGLALTSHNVGVRCKAEFSNVKVMGTDGGTVTGDWQSQDIGILSNNKEPLYAVIKDHGTGTTTVMNPDPNAVVTADWQAWSIDLAGQVGSAGVDLTKIKQLSIGIGDPQATSPGGKGLVYIDDIRLYRPEPNQP